MKAKELLDKIRHKSSYGMKGYLEEEIIFLENLYDIEVKGEFKEFLIGAGRTSGCQFKNLGCLLYTSPSPRDQRGSRMPSSA